MNPCIEKRIYELIFAAHSEISGNVSHADFHIGCKICSVRLWLIGQVFPVYFIFDRNGDELEISHGVDPYWT